MKVTDLLLLSDENIQSSVVAFLRAAGLDVLDVKEERKRGTKDVHLLSEAHHAGRAVLTRDRDFGDLVFRDGLPFTGIILLRPGHLLAPEYIRGLADLLLVQRELDVPFFIVVTRRRNETSIRVLH